MSPSPLSGRTQTPSGSWRGPPAPQPRRGRNAVSGRGCSSEPHGPRDDRSCQCMRLRRLPSYFDRVPRPSHDVGGCSPTWVNRPATRPGAPETPLRLTAVVTRSCPGDPSGTHAGTHRRRALGADGGTQRLGERSRPRRPRVRPRDQRVGLDGDDRLRSGRLGAAMSDENATSFPRSARRSVVLLTAWGRYSRGHPQPAEASGQQGSQHRTPPHRGHCPSMSADRRAGPMDTNPLPAREAVGISSLHVRSRG